ncbi:HAMP domain-containing histidine kinase [Clostridium sp. CM027]|uniref:sensor histidine kinase n=1 Tax=Clostridium sp. CM027 TaxID=2849865 RepID=UPI001C6E3FE8|nr:HAMP domain-containing sensor histidine kinase [Clostridium sp. CM027]MBW9145190.1 HAMP domain-containing histidine kinase [Clostridium sp. CM027]UVE40323.1 HAMP domain-containing histidine kinase [Clostridium sp. CM027]
MNKKKFTVWMFISFLCITFFCVIFGNFIFKQTEKIFYEKAAQIIAFGVKADPNIEQVLISSLKTNNITEINKGKKILEHYGYSEDFLYGSYNNRKSFNIVTVGILFLITLLFFCFGGFLIGLNHIKRKRIDNLAEYLYAINEGNYRINPQKKEDEFSILEDELYKTVVLLRETREKERKEKEKLTNYLADISHQMKTPLTSMSLMIELLDDRPINGEDALYIERISAQIYRLNHLVSSLLILSKLDVGTLTLECKWINVYELVCTAVEPLILMIEKKEQQLSIQEDSDVAFMGDFYWNNEVILNVVKNCVEHTPCGGEISIVYEQNPICTQIIIEDNGKGFHKKDIPHLFTRFYKGENSAKDSVGIGLALAQSIVKKQNGEIRAENKKTGGARFTIKFYLN